jgi:SSS family solute:Na+ symporter
VELPVWPGPERSSAVAAVQNGSFFLFSGYQVEADENGEPQLITPYLTDGYRYTPVKQGREGEWHRIADVPRGVAAAASPALALGDSHIALLSGVDGSLLGTDPQTHPGFSRDIYVYHTITDTWLRRGQVPEDGARVTLPTTPWQGGWVVASGERSPGRRSPQVLWARLIERQSGMLPLDWIVIAVYLASLVAMGLYFARREQSTEDFFLGGRRVPWWAAGLSMFGTLLSAISYMAVPAVVYGDDWRRLGFAWLALPAGYVAIRYFMPFYRRLHVTTAYEYLERRFNVTIRMFASGLFIVSQLARVAVVVYLPALALASVTGLNVYACIGFMGALCIAYTVLGGIEAVIWTDVIQVVVLMSAAVLCLGIVLWHAGGIGNALAIASADHKFDTQLWSWDLTEMSVVVIVIGGFFGSLVDYSSGQDTIQRYLTTPDERGAARGIWTAVLMSIFAAPIFCGLGTALYVFYKLNPQDLMPGKTDEIVPWFVVQQLPVGVSGLVIAGIFAAAMSSLDSALNSAATAYVNDFHRRLKPSISDARALTVARRVTALVGLFGSGMAVLLVNVKELPICDMWAVVIGLIVGGMSGVFMLAVFTERANSKGALVGVVVGAITPWIVQQKTDIQFYMYTAVGILSCLVAGYLASLVLPDDDHDLTGLTIYSMDRGARDEGCEMHDAGCELNAKLSAGSNSEL